MPLDLGVMAFADLAARLDQVRTTIAQSQLRAGLSHDVRIVAVTKTHGIDAVREARRAGLHAVGENRVQEALAKMDAAADVDVEWHLIGTLQMNKARHAAGRFALVHSLDRVELATALGRRVAPGSRQAVLVQVNCSGEPQKGGVEPEGLERLLAAVQAIAELEARGLMTLAEFTEDPVVQRRAFRLLRELRDGAASRGYALPELSMGMSGDYAVAVEEGATMLRLGTALFGPRE